MKFEHSVQVVISSVVLYMQRLGYETLKGSSVSEWHYMIFFLKCLHALGNKTSSFYMRLMMTTRLLKASNILKGRVQGQVFLYDKVFDGS